ncbi:MAG TPA: replicative DNA helicase [Burkholderiaceae bacterium]|nr:replicative DNA helicase [Burkholderiaceae bacterium]HNG77975.1 replicative DNA helicase [Burkholderiaceae bacterium]
MTTALPSEPTAECAVIGAALLGYREVTLELTGEISAGEFYDPAHAAIWAAITGTCEAGLIADLVTVEARMRDAKTIGTLTHRGGVSYLVELMNHAVIDGALDHCRLIREAATLRATALMLDKAREAVMRRDTSSAELLAKVQRDAGELAMRGITQPIQPIKAVLHEATKRYERLYQHKTAITGVPSGLEDLDKHTGGFQPGHLTVIAARPGMGKTAFVIGCTLHAGETGHPALLFSQEMSAARVVDRYVSNDARVKATSLRNGYLETRDWVNISSASSRLSAMPIHIDDVRKHTVASIETKARRWRRDSGVFKTGKEIGVIAIDYLQLIRPPERKYGESKRHLDIGEITKSLAAMAAELGVALLLISQLNRSLESRADKRPMMSDLAESGAIEADSDLICFLYRDEKYNPQTEDRGIAEIIIAKQRDGEEGKVRVKFTGEFTRFDNLSRRSEWREPPYQRDR